MANTAEGYRDRLRDDIDYLLARSEEHERQLAERLEAVDKVLNRQDQQIKNLERAADKLAKGLLALANKPQSAPARLGHVLYWLCSGVAAISLSFGALWLYWGLKSHSPKPDDWMFGLVLCTLGVSAWLTGRAFRYVLAGR